MDESAFPDVNANMAERAPERVEKHQVTGFEVRFVDALRGCGLLVCPAWQHQANGLLIHRPNKAAAIKSGFSRVAAAATSFRRVAFSLPTNSAVPETTACGV